MRVRSKCKKLMATVIIAAMSMLFIPRIIGNDKVLADVAKSQSNTCLGTSKIHAPVAPTSASSAWSGSYVYYGSYKGTPIKFRVLAPSTTAYGGSTVFLDSDTTLFKKIFDDNSNKWADSELRTYLNGAFLTDGSFTSQEQSAIAASTVSAHDLVVGTGAGNVTSEIKETFGQYVALEGDKIFVLDAEEASNINYGYSTTNGNAANKKKSGSYDFWHLRSATHRTFYVGGVGDDGNLYDSYAPFPDGNGVAPALNVDLSKVLFSTTINGALGQVGTSYKLTILDNNLSVNAGSVSLSGTTFSCTATGNADQVSLLITDGAWNASGSSIKYYGTYTGSFDLSTVSLNASDWGTKYQVYLIAEDINGDKETDYASKPLSIISNTRKGWVEEGGNKYYYENYAPVTGWKQIRVGSGRNSKLEWFYFDTNGVMQTGTITIEGKKYKFLPSGALITGWYTHGKQKSYCTKEDGLAIGWKEISGSWYYFNDSGSMQNGWQKVNGAWYYLDSEGVMATGWISSGGSWYYLTSSGAMKIGWLQINDVWYYLNPGSGEMVTGWKEIGGVWYFFKTNGSMACNEYCDGYWLGASGAWTYKHKATWRQDAKGWWFGDDTGWYAKSETLTIDGRSYSFDSNGYWIE